MPIQMAGVGGACPFCSQHVVAPAQEMTILRTSSVADAICDQQKCAMDLTPTSSDHGDQPTAIEQNVGSGDHSAESITLSDRRGTITMRAETARSRPVAPVVPFRPAQIAEKAKRLRFWQTPTAKVLGALGGTACLIFSVIAVTFAMDRLPKKSATVQSNVPDEVVPMDTAEKAHFAVAD